MIKEIWKEIPGTESLYFVSNMGRTKSYHPRYPNMMGKIKTKKAAKYHEMSIFIPGRKTRRISIHRAMWLAFKGPIPKGLHINHIDGVKSNNRLSNLELVTPGGNLQHAYDTKLRIKKFGAEHHISKLSIQDVYKIRILLEEKIPQRKIAEMFGVHQCTISDVKNKVTGY